MMCLIIPQLTVITSNKITFINLSPFVGYFKNFMHLINAWNMKYTVCPTCYRTWMAGWQVGRLLLRVATIRRTTDTFLFISHTTNVLLFKFHWNIFIGVRIIKEMPDSVDSGTHCTILTVLLYFCSAAWRLLNTERMKLISVAFVNPKSINK